MQQLQAVEARNRRMAEMKKRKNSSRKKSSRTRKSNSGVKKRRACQASRPFSG
jgi:hypothetical protein